MNAKILLKNIDLQIDIARTGEPYSDFKDYMIQKMQKKGVIKGLEIARNLVVQMKEEQRTKRKRK